MNASHALANAMILSLRYPLALSLIADGKIDVKPLVTHRFQLEESLAAFEVARRGEGIKVIINCGKI